CELGRNGRYTLRIRIQWLHQRRCKVNRCVFCFWLRHRSGNKRGSVCQKTESHFLERKKPTARFHNFLSAACTLRMSPTFHSPRHDGGRCSSSIRRSFALLTV